MSKHHDDLAEIPCPTCGNAIRIKKMNPKNTNLKRTES